MSRVYLDCPATVLQIHFKDLKLKGTHGNFFKKVQGKIIRTLKYNRKKKKSIEQKGMEKQLMFAEYRLTVSQ